MPSPVARRKKQHALVAAHDGNGSSDSSGANDKSRGAGADNDASGTGCVSMMPSSPQRMAGQHGDDNPGTVPASSLSPSPLQPQQGSPSKEGTASTPVAVPTGLTRVLSKGLDSDAAFSMPSVEGCVDAALSRGHNALALPLGLALKRTPSHSSAKGARSGSYGTCGGAIVFALSEHGAAAEQGADWLMPGRPLLEINGTEVMALPFEVVSLMVAESWRMCCRTAAMQQREHGVAKVNAEAQQAAKVPSTQRSRPTVLRLRMGMRPAKPLPQLEGAISADSFPVTFKAGPLGLGLCWEAKQAAVPPVVEKVSPLMRCLAILQAD